MRSTWKSVEIRGYLRYNVTMKEYAYHNKRNPLAKWHIALAVLVLAVLVAVLTVTLLPRDAATTATVYVGGKAVSTLDLSAEYNPVATYQGVQVRVSDGALQTLYQDKVATLKNKGDKIVYPTLGVVVALD